MSGPSLRTLVVCGFAAHRAARLVSIDTISEPLRERALEWLDRPVMKGQRVLGESKAMQEVNVPATAVKEFFGEMIECPHCVGWHLSYVTLAAYTVARHRRWRWLAFLVEVWAVAGIQSTLASGQAALETFGHVDPDAVNEANEADSRD